MTNDIELANETCHVRDCEHLLHREGAIIEIVPDTYGQHWTVSVRAKGHVYTKRERSYLDALKRICHEIETEEQKAACPF